MTGGEHFGKKGVARLPMGSPIPVPSVTRGGWSGFPLRSLTSPNQDKTKGTYLHSHYHRHHPLSPTPGYLNEEGVAILAPEVPVTPKRRKDSLVKLIGADAIGSKSLDGVENVEDAMQAKCGCLQLGLLASVS